MRIKFSSLTAGRRPLRPKPAPRTPKGDPQLTQAAAELLRTVGCEVMSKQVLVAWHRRLTSTAGIARPSLTQILLNPRLAAFPAEIDRTLRHELAHLVAFARTRGHRIPAHGTEWKRACADLGIPGESRCHDLPLPRRQVNRRYVYRCPRCHFLLRRVRPIKARKRLACHECCKNFARGRFDARFVFVKVPPVPDEHPTSPHPASRGFRLESMVQLTLNFLSHMKESTKDKVSGAINEASGRIKEKVGEKTNDPDLLDKGTGEKIEGKVQSKIGDIKKVFEK